MPTDTLEINVHAALLQIAQRFASTEQTRYYLNGVHLRPLPDGGVLLTATNGHIMFCAADRGGAVSAPCTVRPSDGLLRAISSPEFGWAIARPAAVKARARLTASLGTDEDAMTLATVSAALKPVRGHGDEVERAVGAGLLYNTGGTYPDANRVVPDEMEPGAGWIGAHYVSLLARTAVDLAVAAGGSKKGAHLAFAVEAAAPGLVTFPGDIPAFAVIMPMRGATDPLVGAPAWFQWNTDERAREAAE